MLISIANFTSAKLTLNIWPEDADFWNLFLLGEKKTSKINK